MKHASKIRPCDHVAPCPCGSGTGYADCCGRWHGGGAAPTAEALMRSRYSAYALDLESYLLATWHPTTRPAALALAAEGGQIRWLGLKILNAETTGAATAEVEFVARFRRGGGAAQRLQERSRFVHEDGRWYYVDGDIERS